MEPAALDYMPDGDYVDFPDLVQALLAAGARVSSYPYDGLWFDIGRADDFQQAVEAWAAYTSENGRGPWRWSISRHNRLWTMTSGVAASSG